MNEPVVLTSTPSVAELYDASPDAVAVCGVDGHCSYVNGAAMTLFGDRHLIGRRLWAAVPDLVGTAFAAAFFRVLALGTPARCELRSPRTQRLYDCSLHMAAGVVVAVARERLGDPSDADRTADLARQLERIAYALGKDLTHPEICRVLLEQGGGALGALRGAIWLNDEDGELKQIAAHATSAFEDGVACPEEIPVLDVLRTLEPAWLEGRPHLMLRYPDRGQSHEEISLACLPLTLDDRLVGVMSFAFAGAHAFDSFERSFLSILAQHAAQALMRAEMLARIKQSEARQRFLADVSIALAESLDTAKTMERAARLAVPVLGDGCMIFVAQPDGRMVSTAHAHVDPVREAVLRSLGERGSREDEPFVLKLLDDPRPAVLNDLQPTEIAAAAKAHAPLVAALGLRALIVSPLCAHGVQLGVLCLSRDISDHPFAPAECSLAEEYAVRLALNLDNARLYRETEVAVQRRDDFMSMASHELRTPLTTLQLQVDGLERSLRQRVPDTTLRNELLDRVGRIGRQGKRLNTLVSDLLDVSRMTRGGVTLRRSRVDLAELCREVIDRFDDSAIRRINVVSDGDTSGEWDSQRIDQVVTNLLTNAVKYAQTGPIDVRLRGAPTTVELAVTDNGVGIAPDEQRLIFGKFERASTVKGFAGLGLGLWIAKQIVDAHGGDIAVASEIGRGSTFTVWLPKAQP